MKVGDDDFGLMTYDPAFTNTASCRSAITYIDGDAGILEYRGYPIEQLAERSSYLEVAYLLVHGELPTPAAARPVDDRHHDAHVRARERQGVHAGLPPRRAPDGHARRLRRRAVDLLPGRQGHRRRGLPRHPDDPAHREDADARGVLLPARHGAAVQLPRQRPELRRQLPVDDVQDDRAEVRAGPPARARARHPLHPPRRPRAERVDERGPVGRLDAGRPVLGGRRRGRRALRPAARRGQRGGPAHAAPHRQHRPDPRVRRGREGRQRAPHGLRSPRVQELRPAGQDHQEARPRTSSRSPARTRCSRSRRSSSGSRSRTTTSSRASSTPTSTSTPA